MITMLAMLVMGCQQISAQSRLTREQVGAACMPAEVVPIEAPFDMPQLKRMIFSPIMLIMMFLSEALVMMFILLLTGLSQEEARSFVCAALAEDESGCLASPVIARKAYQTYLAQPVNKEAPPSPLSGLCGYGSVKEAGLIDEGL